MIHRLRRHEDPALLRRFEGHRRGCAVCRVATRARHACAEGVRLHEEVVLDAQRQQRVWWEEVNLADLPSARAAVDRIRELRAATGPIEGVDASVWQGQFPWGAAADAGVGWGIAKASEGNGYQDPQWGWSVSQLLAPGPIVGGSYHFARPDLGNTAGAEAAWYLSRHPAACFSPAMPWLWSLDAESAGGSAAWCYAFMDAVSSRTGYACWFYSFATWISSRLVQAFNRPLWLAWPNPGDPPTEGWPLVTAQQYGSRSIGGVGVDADRFFGTGGALLVLAGVGDPVPPTPAPIPTRGARMIASHPTIGGRLDMIWLDPSDAAPGVAGIACRVMHGWSSDSGTTWAQEKWSSGWLRPGAESITWTQDGKLILSGVAGDGQVWMSVGSISGPAAWRPVVAGPAATPASQGPAGPAGPPGPSYDDGAIRGRLAVVESDLAHIKMDIA